VNDHDETDLEILQLLREDARRTLADIGNHVSMSAVAVRRRIDRLEMNGVIRGYSVDVDLSQLGWGFQAFVELRFAGSAGTDEIIQIGANQPEVQGVFTVAGDPDALVWLYARDIDHLKLAIDRLRTSGHVTGTKTMVVLGSHMQDVAVGRTARA